eukprot:TRINITY_DN1538_c0_g4_i1.p1 TRINITY_DN1538_c0_g4~~TRINITY_DN1538_c0_g4_i1.p1  ORF type:complete len:1010 (+),score=211.09 TRINITY_DN1538_c0_g4_i1:185-3031(+)
MENLQVVEISVAMLRAATEHEQDVLAFKLIAMLNIMIEKTGREIANRFVRAGGVDVIVPSLVLLIAKACKDLSLVECDAPSSNRAPGTPEVIPTISFDGKPRMIRVPAGSYAVYDHSLLEGTVDAREGIKWQDTSVPEKIQLGLILDLLESCLRAAGVEMGIEQFPPSTVCLSLSRDEIMCHLIQVLLRAKTPSFGRLLGAVSYLAKANKGAASQFYKFGIFEILLWKLLAGDLLKQERVLIAKALASIHLIQHPDALKHAVLLEENVEQVTWRDSVLRLYFPEGLLLRFMACTGEQFVDLLETEQDNPDVIWRDSMKAQLIQCLTSHLESYVKARAGDPMAVYLYTPRAPLVYPELSDAVFAAPLYLQNLMDVERFPSYEIESPVIFHNSVMQELRKVADAAAASNSPRSLWQNDVPRILLLLKAQGRVLQAHPQLELPRDTESVLVFVATPALKICIAQKDDVSSDIAQILQQSLWTLRHVVAFDKENGTMPNTSLNLALSVLSLGTRTKPDGTFPDSSSNPTVDRAVASALRLLELAASSNEGRVALKDDIRWRKAFWWALCSAAGDNIKKQRPTPVAFAALDCLDHFLGDQELLERMMKQALHLPLLLLAIPPEDNTWMADDDSDSPSPKALLFSAVVVLRTLAQSLDELGGNTPSARQLAARTALKSVIPVPLLTALRGSGDGPQKFIKMATRDGAQPTAVWTSSVWVELRQKITERLVQHNMAITIGASVGEDELDWLLNFKYDCLKGQIVIKGVYINGYASGQWQNTELSDAPGFVEALQDFLQTHWDVAINPVQWPLGRPKDQDSGYTIEDYVMVLVALRECMRRSIAAQKDDLLRRLRYQLLAQMASADGMAPGVKVEIAGIGKVLASYQLSRDTLLLSELMGALAVQLWTSLASHPSAGTEEILTATLGTFLAISEEIPATPSATNSFALNAVLLAIL